MIKKLLKAAIYNSTMPYVSEKGATTVTLKRQYVAGGANCNTTTVIQRIHSKIR